MPTLKSPGSKLCAHIEFPKKNLQVSTTKFSGHEARVSSWDALIQQLSGGEDAITITLENTSIQGTRVSDLWDFDNPPEGSNVRIYDNKDDGSKDLLFWGTVSEVESVTEGFVVLHVRSLDSKLDEVLGDPITKDDYPDCPDENVGKRKPRAYGVVTRYKPPLVDDNVMTKLDAAITSSDTTIGVEDVSEFDSSGRIQINDEYIDYTGTDTGTDEFTGCTRGAGGTSAESHVSGTDVYEVADMVYLVSEGAVSTIDNVKLVNSDGLAIPAPSAWYTTATSGPSTITFDRIPTVPVATEGSTFKDIDLDEDQSSTANNPTRAAGAHADWTEFNYATIDKDTSKLNLYLRRHAAIDHPNAVIKRAWLVVEHYMSPGADATNMDVKLDSDTLGTLTANTNTPKDVQEDASIHRESKGFEDAHAHTISGSDHGHDVETGQLHTPSFITSYQVYGGKPDCMIDGGFGIRAELSTTTSDYINAKFLTVPNVDAEIRYIRVFTCHGHSSIETRGGATTLFIKGTSEVTLNMNYSTSLVTEYTSKTAPSTTRTMGDLLDVNSYLRVVPSGSSGGIFCPTEIWCEFFLVNPSDNTDTGDADSATPLETSSFTWFEVTPTGASEDDKWDWFQDKVVKVEESGLGSGEYCYVLRAFFTVEFTHSTTEPTKTVLCNIDGGYSNGALILYDVALNVLGLSTDNIDAASWTTAYGLSNTGFGGVLENFETARDIFNRVGEQMRISVHWEAGKLKALYKPAIADIGTPTAFISKDNIQKGTLSVSRYPLSELFNRVQVNYKPSYLYDGFNKSTIRESSTSQALYGKTGKYEINADFVTQDSEANALGDQLIEYKGWAVDVIECILTRDFIGLKRGDIVAISHRLGSWPKVEVLEVEVRPRTGDVASGVRILGIERRTG